jgi:hypothetical protein
MADRVVFVRYGNPVPGREEAAVAIGKQAAELWDRLLAAGEIEGYLPVMLDPHGGDLAGFVVAWGDGEKMARLAMIPEWQQLNLGGAATLREFGVIGGTTGEAYFPMMDAYCAACAASTA